MKIEDLLRKIKCMNFNTNDLAMKALTVHVQHRINLYIDTTFSFVYLIYRYVYIIFFLLLFINQSLFTIKNF